MSLAAAHALPTPLALALVLGANVGGAIAPLLSLSGSPPAARRVPLGNLIMRARLAHRRFCSWSLRSAGWLAHHRDRIRAA